MPSPFLGMDPYLEDPARWPDMHQRLITYIADALQPQLRPRYVARIGERVYIAEPPKSIYPDVLLVRRALREAATVTAAPATSTEASIPAWPVLLDFPPVEHREPFVEIVSPANDEVITVIEVLSPANKTGEGRRQYHLKQQQVLESQAHLVEVDLLAAGDPVVAIPEEALTALRPFRYLINVRRSSQRYRSEAYPIRLVHPLPRVRVPLREPDLDVELDLRAVLAQCYTSGAYDALLDYGQPPRTSLSPEEAAWLDGLLKGKGLRL